MNGIPPGNWSGGSWRWRGGSAQDCLWSLVLSVVLLLLGIAGLKLLGVVIDVIRYALDPSLPPPVYPFGWNPPVGWSALQIVTALALAIVAQAVLRAALTYAYNMITARLTQGEIVPELRAQVYAKLQRLEFQFLRLARLQFDFQPGDGRRAEHAAVRGRRVVAGGDHDADAGGVRGFHVAHPAVADGGVPVRVAAVVVAGAFLFGAAASGLPAQPRADGQHGVAVQRERARDADGERVRRGTAPGPAV